MSTDELYKILHKRFVYDKEDGRLLRKNGKRNRVKLHHSGYMNNMIEGKMYTEHRLVWLYNYGYLPDFIDHINGVRNDNRLENLRVSTSAENNKNCCMKRNNTSGVTGVIYQDKNKKFRAYITHNKKRIALGMYHSKVLAAEARKDAEYLYGFSERHGT